MKAKLRYIIGLLVAGIICVASVRSDGQALQALKDKFNAAQNGTFREKLYMHVNKSSFVTGEILWFRIYSINGNNNRPADVSKVAYVELLNKEQRPVLQAKIALISCSGDGSFLLPAALPGGEYTIRAYTSWMKNFDPAYFYMLPVKLVNPQSDMAAEKPAASGYDVQFFPEGGHLVKGLRSKVAFKVTALDGNYTDATGAIVDGKNDTLVRFKTLKFGIGSFFITPSDTSGYKAVISIALKTKIIKALPQITDAGYVMETHPNVKGWQVDIRTTGVNSQVFLIAHSRDTIEFAEAATLSAAGAVF